MMHKQQYAWICITAIHIAHSYMYNIQVCEEVEL